VPENQLERIFERYVSLRGLSSQEGGTPQEPVAGTPVNQHLGIGLWIVRRNLEAVGGGVRAENAPGGGLAMVFWLPLAS
jgi:two-component system sensor histidine kinase ChvG